MVYLKEILQAFEQAAPFMLQEDYDNSGIQLGSPEKQVTKCLTCVDVTPEIIDEARAHDCDLIVSHHPLIFSGLKKITGSHYVERVIIDAIKHDIAIMSVHTNLDAAHNGVNSMLAGKLGLENVQVLNPRPDILKKLVTFCPTAHAEKLRAALFAAGAGHIGNYDCCSYNIDGFGTFRAGEGATPFVGSLNEVHQEAEVRIETIFPSFVENILVDALIQNHPYEEVAYDIYKLDQPYLHAGIGLAGTLPSPMPVMRFLATVKEVLNIPNVRHSKIIKQEIHKVAICGGSGGFLLSKAIAGKADAFVTAELKYNQFFDAHGKILLVDAGHYETEQFTKELLAKIIQEKIRNFAIRISTTNTNPVCYY